MFFKNIQKNQPAATVHQQQSTITSIPESTLCVELSDEELSAVTGGLNICIGYACYFPTVIGISFDNPVRLVAPE